MGREIVWGGVCLLFAVWSVHCGSAGNDGGLGGSSGGQGSSSGAGSSSGGTSSRGGFVSTSRGWGAISSPVITSSGSGASSSSGGSGSGSSGSGTSGSSGSSGGGSGSSSSSSGGSSGGFSACNGSTPVAAGPFEGPQNPQCQACGTPRDPGTFPATGFDAMPAYIPNDVAILTFDDVPNGDITLGDLAILKTNNLHVDFFTNTFNYQGPNGYPVIQQIVTDGHYLGNHTMTHPYLPTEPNAAAVEAEISGVETVVDMLTMGTKPHLTRFRAPFGAPFQADWPNEADTLVAPVVSRYAVEVDWNFDSLDTTGRDPLLVIMAGMATPGTGNPYGIILLHGVLQNTEDALQGIIDYLRTSGFKLATVEDYICWEYGKHSWDIVNQLNAGAGRVEN